MSSKAATSNAVKDKETDAAMAQLVKEIVTLDALKGKLNVKEFVEKLASSKLALQPQPATTTAASASAKDRNSNNLITSTSSSAVPKSFDPKPYIKVYEAAVEELLRVKRKTQNKVDDLLDQDAAMEKSTKTRFKDLIDSFDGVQTAFEALETRLNVVATTAVRIGEQLETIDRQRRRAEEAIDLIQYFIEFNKGLTKRLDKLRKSGPDGEYKTVIIAKRLNAIAKEVDTVGTEAGRANIERYCEDLERSVLDQFDKGLRKGNRALMQRCAKTLYDFNGGNSCMQIYINQIPFFLNKKELETELDFLHSLEAKEGAADQGDEKWVQVPKADPSLLALYDDIRETCRQEWITISEVFPNPHYVMQQFVQRVFAQSIQNHIESLLEQAEKQSLLTYLRALSSSSAATASLVEDLHRFDDEIISPKVGNPVLSAVLDRSIEDLFVPYFEGNRYIEAESKCLLNRFERILAPFFVYVCNRAKALQKRGIKTASFMLPAYQAQLKEQAAANAGLTGIFNSLVAASADSAASAALAGSNANRSSDEMGIPSIETMLKLFVPHIESLTRCKQLVPTNVLPTTAESFFMTLVQFQPYYLETALIIAMEDFQYASQSLEPDLRTLHVIQVASQILQLVQIHFQNCVMPLLSTSPPAHRETVMYKNQFMEVMENKIADLLQKQLDVVGHWIGSILNKQKRTDFKPKDDAAGINITATSCCDFMKKVQDRVRAHMYGENITMVLNEIGNTFHRLLLEHFKKFSVSQSGGLILTKDLAKYNETIIAFDIPALNERFEMLREIGNLFIVKPENLKSVLNEGCLSRIEVNLLHPYVVLRADWSRLAGFERDIFHNVGDHSATLAAYQEEDD